MNGWHSLQRELGKELSRIAARETNDGGARHLRFGLHFRSRVRRAIARQSSEWSSIQYTPCMTRT